MTPKKWLRPQYSVYTLVFVLPFFAMNPIVGFLWLKFDPILGAMVAHTLEINPIWQWIKYPAFLIFGFGAYYGLAFSRLTRFVIWSVAAMPLILVIGFVLNTYEYFQGLRPMNFYSTYWVMGYVLTLASIWFLLSLSHLTTAKRKGKTIVALSVLAFGLQFAYAGYAVIEHYRSKNKPFAEFSVNQKNSCFHYGLSTIYIPRGCVVIFLDRETKVLGTDQLDGTLSCLSQIDHKSMTPPDSFNIIDFQTTQEAAVGAAKVMTSWLPEDQELIEVNTAECFRSKNEVLCYQLYETTLTRLTWECAICPESIGKLFEFFTDSKRCQKQL